MGKSRLVADLDPTDFASLRNKLAKRWGPVRLRDYIQRIRSVFKHAFAEGCCPRRQVADRYSGRRRESAKFLRPSRPGAELREKG